MTMRMEKVASHQRGRLSVAGLVTQPDRGVPGGAGSPGHQRGSTRQTGPSLKEIARARGVPVDQPDSVNTPEGVAQLKAWRPDLLVVAAYGQILKADVLEAAAWGGVNVHASLLPKYRGAAPVAWAILNGETETGVTIIRMSAGLDAGDMLAKAAIPICLIRPALLARSVPRQMARFARARPAIIA